MSDPSWADLKAWAEARPSSAELDLLASALSEGPREFLEALRSLALPMGDGGLIPAALALLFWRLHGVPFNGTPYHQNLLTELSTHLQPASQNLALVLDSKDVALVYSLAEVSPKVTGFHPQVAACSDALVVSGLASHIPLESSQAEDAAATAWLAERLHGESVVSCHLSPSRHERTLLLLGERPELWVLGPSNSTLPLYASESLSDDEVHLLSADGDYFELFLPPTALQGSTLLSEAYASHRSSGMTPAQALGAALAPD